MTDLNTEAMELAKRAETAGHSERMRLQPQIDSFVTRLMMQGHVVPRRLMNLNNALKDEALDDMFDNMPV